MIADREGTSPLAGQAVVDVSNVCRSKALAPPRLDADLGRLRQVIAAWQALHGRGGSLRYVADASLLARLKLSHPGVGIDRVWRSTVAELDIQVTGYADHEILDCAEDERRFVLSGDHFKEHRRSHPWIETQPERFLRWRVTDSGLRFEPSGIRPLPEHQKSHWSEVRRLADARLSADRPADRELLESRWACSTASCLRAQFGDELLLEWPVKDARGRARCPGCGALLTASGPRGLYREIVVSRGGPAGAAGELGRFPLEHDVPLVIGRGRRDLGIALDALNAVPVDVGRISRQHALVALDDQCRMQVCDLGSSNGTDVGSAAGQPGRRIPPDEFVLVPPGGYVELAGLVRVRLSGQRYPGAGTQPLASGASRVPLDGATDVRPVPGS